MKTELDKVILVKMNVGTPEGKKLQKEYKVRGLPSFAVLNPSGEKVASWVGYSTPEQWLSKFKENVAK